MDRGRDDTVHIATFLLGLGPSEMEAVIADGVWARYEIVGVVG